jgi:hypothetical protein
MMSARSVLPVLCKDRIGLPVAIGLFRSAWALTGSRAVAEDVVQD